MQVVIGGTKVEINPDEVLFDFRRHAPTEVNHLDQGGKWSSGSWNPFHSYPRRIARLPDWKLPIVAIGPDDPLHVAAGELASETGIPPLIIRSDTDRTAASLDLFLSHYAEGRREELKAKVLIWPELGEMDEGNLLWRTWLQLWLHNRDAARRVRRGGRYDERPSGGECGRDVMRRADLVLLKLTSLARSGRVRPGDRVPVFTHGGFVKALLVVISGRGRYGWANTPFPGNLEPTVIGVNAYTEEVRVVVQSRRGDHM